MDTSWVPEDCRSLVEEALTYTAQDWSNITTGLSPQRSQLFVLARGLEQEYRHRQIRENNDFIAGLIDQTSSEADEESGQFIFAIFCLPDETLDLVISTFTPEMRALLGVHN
jgi:hypothetical protein